MPGKNNMNWLDKFKNFNKITESNETVFIKKTSTTVINITVNGKAQKLNLTRDMDQNAITQMLSQLGANAEDMQGILDQLAQHAGLTASQTENATDTGKDKLTTSAEKVLCPECRHTVAQNRPCMYCGHVFAGEKEKTMNEVDNKFLKNDVKSEQKTDEKQELKNKDSYKNRLEGM